MVLQQILKFQIRHSLCDSLFLLRAYKYYCTTGTLKINFALLLPEGTEIISK